MGPMVKFRWVVTVLVMCLSGCSFLNFSANYYTPPVHYQNEIVQIWQNLTTQIPFKYQYKISIIDGKDSNRLDGIPAISDRNVLLPEDFVKYVYQNYYDDRGKIFTSVIIHEVSHSEFDLPSKPPEEHVKTDAMAIELLGANSNAPEYFYKSLYVMKNYWFARKGVAGHSLNVGWNALSLASAALGGPSLFIDWYATDLNKRMAWIAKRYALKSKQPFKRSKQ